MADHLIAEFGLRIWEFGKVSGQWSVAIDYGPLTTDHGPPTSDREKNLPKRVGNAKSRLVFSRMFTANTLFSRRGKESQGRNERVFSPKLGHGAVYWLLVIHSF